MADDTRNQGDRDLPTNLASPAQRALLAHGSTRLEQLAVVSEEELAQLHGMVPKARGQLRAALAERGLSFASGQPDAKTGQ